MKILLATLISYCDLKNLLLWAILSLAQWALRKGFRYGAQLNHLEKGVTCKCLSSSRFLRGPEHPAHFLTSTTCCIFANGRIGQRTFEILVLTVVLTAIAFVFNFVTVFLEREM